MTDHNTIPGFPCDFDLIVAEETEPARHLATWLLHALKPVRLLDVGCGPGIYMDPLIEQGVHCDGVDSDPRALAHPNTKLVDITTAVPPTGYDVVLSLEVGEHLDTKYSDAYIRYITGVGAKYIVFSAAVPGQPGHGHCNCQWHGFWLVKLHQAGYIYDHVLTTSMKDHLRQGIAMGWMLGNGMVFRALD